MGAINTISGASAGHITPSRPTLRPSVVPAPAAAPRVRTLGPSIVDDVSAAGRRAAAARTAMAKQLAAYGTGPVLPKVDLTAPRDLQADSSAMSAKRVDPSKLAGNQIAQRAEAMRSEGGLANQVRSGQSPLGPSWTDGPPEAQRANRPGKDIIDAAARVRESNEGLSASIGRGEGMLQAGSIKDLNTQSMRQRLQGPTEVNGPG